MSPSASSTAPFARPNRRRGRFARVAKLLLLDGNSLTYRAFFALPTDMATASGQVTNAVFGFTSMFINLVKDHKPDGVLVAFDRPEPTFRHYANPEYKATREAAPDILRQQMGLVREVLEGARRHHDRAGRVRGRRHHRHRRQTGQGARRRRHHRHRRPRQLPAGQRPARQGALQPPWRQRLRAVRRGRHPREDRRVTPAQYPRVRRAARRQQRQPARHPGRRREDGGEADPDVRRPRRHLRPRRRADAEAAARR